MYKVNTNFLSFDELLKLNFVYEQNKYDYYIMSTNRSLYKYATIL